MATADHDSSLQIGPAAPGGDAPVPRPADTAIWLDGGVLACACPKCAAPMSIRLWLLTADCWRCGTSIELSAEQERQALRLLKEQERTGATVSSPPRDPSQREPGAESPGAADTPSTTDASKAQPGGQARPKEPDGPQSPPPLPGGKPGVRRVPAAEAALRRRLRRSRDPRPIGAILLAFLQELPSWLISLVVHLVAMLLLSITFLPEPEEDPELVLSTSVGPMDLETLLGSERDLAVHRLELDDGGLLEWKALPDVEPVGRPELELTGSKPDIGQAIRPSPRADPLVLPPLPPASAGRAYLGRDPAMRGQVAAQSGGSSETEAAVARGLRWLARHQNEDGSWSLRAFHKAGDCDGQCKGAAREESLTAATAMALLPFLGAGQTHTEGRYTDEVLKGLSWLVEHQKPSGDLRGEGNFGRMYAHGQSAIVLCEAYALTGDDQLRDPAQRALYFIVEAQHAAGGWRYHPGEAGDTSVVGWQLMALNSGRMAHLHVPDETLARAINFLDSVETDRVGGTYSYMPGRGRSHVMTAEALLCRQYLGWPRDHEGMKVGVRFLVDEHLPRAEKPDAYYWYYATQVLHHYGGKDWRTWNAKMRDVLLDTQIKKGHAVGSWAPEGGHGPRAGRLYQTALAICTLEVYYRYMPLYGADAVTREVKQAPMPESVDLFEVAR